jgi:malonyl CoA-acyl carrier protein transacylase
MIAHVFPGQGSQKKGMGAELFDSVAEFGTLEPQIDALLGYSIRDLCLNDPEGRLRDTRYTQPALYVINALHWYQAAATAAAPTVFAGHSLGEYNALLAAGVFDFLTGLRLVKRRGELMAQVKNGGMAAVLGLDADRIAPTLAQAGLGSLDVANYNSPNQTVISGQNDDIQKAQAVLEAAGAKMYVLLPVSAAFHSRYMASAAQAFEDFLWGFTFRAPRVPVIANITAQSYAVGDDPTTVVRHVLVQQITQPVKWAESVRHMASLGVTEFRETGPGNVLSKLVLQIIGQ